MADLIQKRYDFKVVYDVQHGNPNGDPDMDNMPREDPETRCGFVTGVCLKRKIRDYVTLVHEGEEGRDIWVKHRAILADAQKEAYKEVKAEPGLTSNEAAQQVMIRRFFDVRAFGAVMTTGKAKVESDSAGNDASTENPAKKGVKKEATSKKYDCGQVRGPVQIDFSHSADPIRCETHSITRVALTNVGDTKRGKAHEKECEEGDSTAPEDPARASSGQMGRVHTIPYALYTGIGSVLPAYAKRSKFTTADCDLLWEALEHLFDLDRSATRGLMTMRALIIFEHESALGDVPAHRLHSRVKVRKVDGVEEPRSFADYIVTVDDVPLTEDSPVRQMLPAKLASGEAVSKTL